MDINQILQSKISYQENVWSPLQEELTVFQVLSDIKHGKHIHSITLLRNLLLENKFDEYNNQKKKLPAVTFSGTFYTPRRKENINTYSFLVIIDIDKLAEENITPVRVLLNNDKHIIACWKSPSGLGFKGLIQLEYDQNLNVSNLALAHSYAFESVKEYFSNEYNITIDPSGSDITRLCFMSADESIIINNTASKFLINQFPKPQNEATSKFDRKKTSTSLSYRNLLYNPNNRNKISDRIHIQLIIKFLTKKGISITSSYNDWIRVAMAISNTFTYEIGEKYFIRLSELDSHKFNKINCINMLHYCYMNSSSAIKFNTIVYLASKRGFKTKSIRNGGVLKVEVERLSQVSASLNGSQPDAL